ncbi:MAG: procyclic acidic repetitive family protein, partial [Anaerolineae bacterium]|nr:procyclic acidic repetitive family protein [Anaerolineae bacterium]
VFVPIVMPTAIPDSTPEADVTPEGDSTPEPDVTPEGDSTPEPDSTAEADSTPEPEPTATSEPTPMPTATPLPLDLENLVTGTQGVWLISRTLGSQNIGTFSNRVFCRLNIRDFYSWFLPDLLLDVANVDPLSVVDKVTPLDLVSAIANDECAGGMLSADQLESLSLDGITLGQRSVAFPYGVVMYPLEVELGIQLRLNEVLPAMAFDPLDGRALRLLIGQDALLPVTDADIAELSQFINTTGYDLSQLGR